MRLPWVCRSASQSLDTVWRRRIERERRQSEAGGGGEGVGVTFAGGQPRQGGVGVNMGDGVLVRRHPVAVLGARDLSCRGPRPGYSGNNV